MYLAVFIFVSVGCEVIHGAGFDASVDFEPSTFMPMLGLSMNSRKLLTLVLLGSSLSAPALAGIVVDGNIDDWLTPGGKATWTVNNPGINRAEEDKTGSGAYYLSPGWGGQAYDAEALFATIIGDKLFIALATGHNPATTTNVGANVFGAGDFAIDFGRNKSFEMGINTYRVNGHASDTFGDLGGVYRVTDWYYGLWNAAGEEAAKSKTDSTPDRAHPTSIKDGNKLGDATYAVSSAPQTGYGKNLNDPHYFYEMSVDLSLLRAGGWDGSSPFDIHWTQNCANDSISVDPANYVPEPGSMALLTAGLLGIAGIRRKKLAG